MNFAESDLRECGTRGPVYCFFCVLDRIDGSHFKRLSLIF